MRKGGGGARNGGDKIKMQRNMGWGWGWGG